jgi:nucleoside 2-deoxyribosyltransferase
MDIFENSIVIAVVVISIIAVLLSFWSLYQTRKRTKEFTVRIGDLISPQRESVENIIYNSSETLTKDLGFLSDANHILFDSSPKKDMLIRTKLPDFSFFEDMGIFLPDIKVDKKMAMCLMPFNKKFDKTKTIIAESCLQAGYTFRRSDDELLADNTDIRKTIVRMILEAQVVIAVLDGRNPNVFYEIGIAHSMGKLVLMVVNLSREERKWQEVDILSNRLITYNNPLELRDKLIRTLNALKSNERREETSNS